MKTNFLSYAVGLCLMVILLLGISSRIPSFTIGDKTFNKIDLFSAIRPEKKKEPLIEVDFPELDSLQATIDSVAEESQQLCRPGITCIEDYSPDSTAMTRFLQHLVKVKEDNHTMRIAFYGDSFIEGDVFCGSVRDTLQTLFGGRGVGYVPITSHVTGFRNTIKHEFDQYKTYSIVSKKDSTDVVDFGPAGYTFRPLEGNQVTYKVSRQRYMREFSVMRLYYRNLGNAVLQYTINDTLLSSTLLKKGSKLKEWKLWNPKAKRISYQFEPFDSLYLYGASFENGHGVYVDNFSMRGNSGIGLYSIPDKMFREFNAYRDYKLIILQYGLNVVGADSARYNWYADRMITVINKMKKVFPRASILLLSVSDRATNEGGEFHTINTIPALRNAQRYIAQQTGIAFWDLYEAMGGEDSMVRFVESTPALAAKDYTHLTFKGGRKLGGKLVKSLLFELERYEQKNDRTQQ